MTQGIPWTALGIQPEARASAEAAARRAGVPVEEWLNEMIRKSSEGLPPSLREGLSSGRDKLFASRDPAVGDEAGGTRATHRPAGDYGELARELDALNQRNADTALPRGAAPHRSAGHDPLGNPRHAGGERSPDLVGTARGGEPIEVIERTIRAIIQHLESADRRNAESFRQLQAQMRGIAARVDTGRGVAAGEDHGRAFTRIENRLEALANRIEATESAAPEANIAHIEHRLAALATKIEHLTRTSDTGPSLSPFVDDRDQIDEPAGLDPDDGAAIAEAGDEAGADKYVSAFMRRQARRRGASGDAEHEDHATLGAIPAAGDDENADIQLKRPPKHLIRRFAELTQNLQSSLAHPAQPQEVADLRALVQELSAKVDSLSRRNDEPVQADSELTSQIGKLSQRLAATESRFDGLDSIEHTLAQLIERLDTAEQHLHQAAGSRSEGAQSFERQIASLFEQLEASRQAMIDVARCAAAEAAEEAVGEAATQAARKAVREAQEAALEAAREAARSYLDEAGVGGLGTEDAEILEILQNGLRELHGDVDASDRKTEASLNAVQASLNSIAERLAKIERHESPSGGGSPAERNRMEPTGPVPAERSAEEWHPAETERPRLSETLAELRLPPLARQAFETPDRQAEPIYSRPAEPAGQSPKPGGAGHVDPESNLPREPGSGPPRSVRGDPAPQTRRPGGREAVADRVEPRVEDAPDAAPSLRGARTTHELLAAARRAAEAAAAQGGHKAREGRPRLRDRLRIPLSRNRGSDTPNSDKEAPERNPDATAAGKGSRVRKPILLAVAAVILFAGSLEIYRLIKPHAGDLARQPAVGDQESPAAVTGPASRTDDARPAERAMPSARQPGSIRDESQLEMPEPPRRTGLNQAATGTLASASDTPESKAADELHADAIGDGNSAAAVPTAPITVANLPPAAADAADLPDLPRSIGPEALRQAAIDGNPIAQFEVASRLAEGRGIKADLPLAAAWYRRAAASGLAPAQYRLGSMYEKGVGVTKDRDTARVWYERAAAQGNRKAMHNLAVLYADGINGQPDFEAAARWFRAAAELGLGDSQYNLGILHVRGLGVPQNAAEAYKWFAIVANGGDKDAAFRRDAIAEKLDKQTLAASKLAAQTWKAKPLTPEANAVRLPNEGWAIQASEDQTTRPGPDIVRNAQKLLTRLGYRPGPADGVWGPRTKTAIERFQQDAGVEPTGALTPDLIRKLQGASI